MSGWSGTGEPYPMPDDAPAVEAAAPRAKRKASMSPTKRTLAELRKRGWVAQVVERWNPHAKVRVDLFGVIDLVAIEPAVPALFVGEIERPGGILGIQACAGSSHAARRAKVFTEPRARQWVEAGGRLEIWSWSKRGGRGARKLWTLRVEAFTAESWGAE